jgi:thioredoxin reductase
MESEYEVIIIGGSYAGLSAAMALGRASRKVLVIDSGKPCNRYTPHSHNFITQDGETPAAIAAKAREQVLAYPTVKLMNATASAAVKTGSGFTITTDSGETFDAQKLLFATGVKDIMPGIEGFEACWGTSVVHCPYCHGYEVKGKATAVIANGDAAMHYASLLLQWTKHLTLFTNGAAEFTAEQMLKLDRHSIAIVEGLVDRLSHTNGYVEEIVLKDGTAYPYTVIYNRPAMIQHSDLPQQLGCAINEQGIIVVDDFQKTNIPGVFAAGDCSTMLRAVAPAVAAGMKAGAVINNEMCTEVF